MKQISDSYSDSDSDSDSGSEKAKRAIAFAHVDSLKQKALELKERYHQVTMAKPASASSKEYEEWKRAHAIATTTYALAYQEWKEKHVAYQAWQQPKFLEKKRKLWARQRKEEKEANLRLAQTTSATGDDSNTSGSDNDNDDTTEITEEVTESSELEDDASTAAAQTSDRSELEDDASTAAAQTSDRSDIKIIPKSYEWSQPNSQGWWTCDKCPQVNKNNGPNKMCVACSAPYSGGTISEQYPHHRPLIKFKLVQDAMITARSIVSHLTCIRTHAHTCPPPTTMSPP